MRPARCAPGANSLGPQLIGRRQKSTIYTSATPGARLASQSQAQGPVTVSDTRQMDSCAGPLFAFGTGRRHAHVQLSPGPTLHPF